MAGVDLAADACAGLLCALLPICTPMRARLIIRDVVKAEVRLTADDPDAARAAAAEFGRRLYWPTIDARRSSYPRPVVRLEILGLTEPHMCLMANLRACAEHGLDFRHPVRRGWAA